MGVQTAYLQLYLPADNELFDEQLNTNTSLQKIDAGVLAEHNGWTAHAAAPSPHTGHAVFTANTFTGLQTVQVAADSPAQVYDAGVLAAAGVQTGERVIYRAHSYDAVDHHRDFMWRARTTSNAGNGVLELLTLLDAQAPPTVLQTIDQAGNVVSVGGITSVSATVTGSGVTYSGAGARISGDMSNATLSNRLAIQTVTVNGGTTLHVIPNGTGVASSMALFANSSQANVAFGQFGTDGSSVYVSSSIAGTGTYLPMIFYTGGSERLRVLASGNVGIANATPQCLLDVGGMIRSTGFGGIGTAAYSGVEVLYSGGGAIQAVVRPANTYTTLAIRGNPIQINPSAEGYVGIGTTTPSYPLHVVGYTQVSQGLGLFGAQPQAGIPLALPGGVGGVSTAMRWMDAGAGVTNILVNTVGGAPASCILRFDVANGTSGASVPALVLDGNAHVTVGTSSVYTYATKLNLPNGAVPGDYFYLYPSALNSNYGMGINSTEMNLFAPAGVGSHISFRAGNSAATLMAFIDMSSGRIYSYGGNPGAGTVSGFATDRATSASYAFQSGVSASIIDQGYANTWINASMRAIKHEPMAVEHDEALDILQRLAPVRYFPKWEEIRGKPGAVPRLATDDRMTIVGKRPRIGLIAEDLESVLPEVVAIDPATKQPHGIMYGELAAFAVRACQALLQEVQALQAQVAQLQSGG